MLIKGDQQRKRSNFELLRFRANSMFTEDQLQ